MSFEYVLTELSYANFILYGSVIPSFDSDKDTKKEDKEVIYSRDPMNEERLEKLFDTFV